MVDTGSLATRVIESNTLNDVELRLAAEVLALQERNRELHGRISAAAVGMQDDCTGPEVLGLLRGTHRWDGDDIVEVGEPA